MFALHAAQRVGRDASRKVNGGINRFAGDAVAESHISRLIHRDAAYPARIGIWAEGSLLKHRGRSVRTAHLIPAHAGRNGMIKNERFDPVGKLAIGETVHRPIAERVEKLSRSGLCHAGTEALCGEVCDWKHGGAGESGVRGGREVHVKSPQLEHVLAEVHEEGGFARGGSYRSVHVGWQQAGDRGLLLEADNCRVIAGDHRVAIEGAGISADEVAAVQENIERHVISVGPDTQFWVIGVIAIAKRKGVAVVGAGGVAGGRDRHALRVRKSADGKLREDPAVGYLVILHDGIAVVVGFTPSAEAVPEGVSFGRSGNESAGGFVKHRKLGVNPLYILRGAHRSVGIGRGILQKKSVVSLAQTGDIQAGVGSHWRQSDRLQGEIGRGVFGLVAGRRGGEDFQQSWREAMRLSGSHLIKFGERRRDIVLLFADYTDRAFVACAASALGESQG